jgi:hypothetical protein
MVDADGVGMESGRYGLLSLSKEKKKKKFPTLIPCGGVSGW